MSHAVRPGSDPRNLNSSRGFNIRPIQIAYLSFVGALLTGCGEENAAKVAPWLGMETLNERKADVLGSLASKEVKACKRRNDDLDGLRKCIEDAVKHVITAEELYMRDCRYGNKRACRKIAEQRNAWDKLGNE